MTNLRRNCDNRATAAYNLKHIVREDSQIIAVSSAAKFVRNLRNATQSLKTALEEASTPIPGGEVADTFDGFTK